jgi:hypothetical protein
MEKMDQAREELDGLPPTLSDAPQTKLLALFYDFVSELSEYINGSVGHSEFLRDFLGICKKLALEIGETRPKFEVPCKTSAIDGNGLAVVRSISTESFTSPATPRPKSCKTGA